jgi:DNA-binding response OmpR family regulator
MDYTINSGSIADLIRQLTRGAPLNVLVVDDDELGRTLIGDHLAAQGLRIEYAANGQEALDLLQLQSFSVLLVDWQMPVMDGITLIERVRALGMSDTYIIMLTARSNSVDYEQGYRAGVDDYLTKKTLDVELLARIRTGLNTYALRCDLKQAREELARLKGPAGADEVSPPCI